MTSALNVLMSRPHWSERWAYVAGGGLLTAVGIASVAWKHNPWGFVFLAVGLTALSEVRRKVEVRDDELRVQGRLVRRIVPLADLGQVAVSPLAEVWVRPVVGRAFYLRMVSRVAGGSSPGVWEFPVRLRELALGHGARLEEWAAGEKLTPPSDIHPAFSR